MNIYSGEPNLLIMTIPNITADEMAVFDEDLMMILSIVEDLPIITVNFGFGFFFQSIVTVPDDATPVSNLFNLILVDSSNMIIKKMRTLSVSEGFIKHLLINLNENYNKIFNITKQDSKELFMKYTNEDILKKVVSIQKIEALNI
jgi:hypothetical protein